MTDLSTEPVAVPAAPITPPPPPEQPKPAAQEAKEVDHTPGGWPIVPLALSGANGTVGAVAAASLAGGPIAAAVAATGMVVLGTVAAARSRKPNDRRDARRTAARTAGRDSARRTGHRSSGTGSHGNGGSRSGGSRSGGSGSRSGKVPGQHRRSNGGPTARHGSTGGTTLPKTRNSLSKHAAPKHSASAGKGAAGRLGQVKALRAAQKDATGSRGGQRKQTTDARRAVADARRNARTNAGGTGRLGKHTGPASRLLGGTARKARAMRDAAVAKQRNKRDAKTGGTVAAQRAQVRKAPARKAARQALRRSAARFHGRRLLAALLSLPVGLLGLLTSPIGRKLRLPWLVNPGRRLYRRMVQTAGEQRAARDETAREKQREQEAAADAEAAKDGTDGIAEDVQRPAATVPTSTNIPVSEGEHVSGFRFEEAAAEMEQAANQYEPENAMEILAMVEGLPAALTAVANVMKILAERSDSEFPLEKEVADGFNDIFGALMSAVAVAEDMGPLFRQAHEQDIARHEDPRNGTEAEKGWNV
ncbi:hypothetical protein [Streptomyces triticiradicis]|uniref:Uncharacterized protein n=1 Tax=Streptomyces triticiradicis TaxID=2651189 RepID=A0A7J5D2P4_9ACTN|nr:hypothetical protein [Streptomyces triticiradicis]KAB1977841.1 hypothetical protein F8144_40820 [Streptomyces triticiradicis]